MDAIEQKAVEPSPVMNVAEVAALMRITESSVKGLHRVHKLRAIKLGRHNRWRRADVLAYIDALNCEK
jgi:excisionase family DNA binding protein